MVGPGLVQDGHLSAPVVQIAKLAIHRRKSDVGDVVEPLELVQHGFANVGTCHFRLVTVEQLGFGLSNDAVDFRGRNRTFCRRDMQFFMKLPRVEFFTPPITLDDDEILLFDRFVGGKSPLACRAFPSATDGFAPANIARINDACIRVAAKRATQTGIPFE